MSKVLGKNKGYGVNPIILGFRKILEILPLRPITLNCNKLIFAQVRGTRLASLRGKASK